MIGTQMQCINHSKLGRCHLGHLVVNLSHFALTLDCHTQKVVKRIGWYLKGSQSQSLIIQPTTLHKFDCFVDDDFAGIWGFEDK